MREGSLFDCETFDHGEGAVDTDHRYCIERYPKRNSFLVIESRSKIGAYSECQARHGDLGEIELYENARNDFNQEHGTSGNALNSYLEVLQSLTNSNRNSPSYSVHRSLRESKPTCCA